MPELTKAGSDTARLEAFSDGVFAIAITLLVLEIGVPDGDGSLAHRLSSQWLVYATFVVSFAVIGIMWINHHEMFRTIRTVDHGLNIANLGLLLTVSFLPYPTKVMGKELSGADFADRRTAAMFYALSFVAISVAFNLTWWRAAKNRRLIHDDVSQRSIQARTRRSMLGIPAYLAVTAIAAVNPEASLVAGGCLALIYLIPNRVVEQISRRSRPTAGVDAGP